MLFYTMRPDNVAASAPVFTRYGGLTKRRETAVKAAKRTQGRVYGTDGAEVSLVADFFPERQPEARLDARQWRRAVAEATLFGVTS